MDKDRKKIVLYCSSLNRGGAERVFVNLAEYFNNHQYEVYIVTQYQMKDEYPISAGITRIISDLTEEEMKKNRIANLFLRIHKLRKIMKKINPDLVFSNNGKNNFMAMFTNTFLKSKVVVSVIADPKMEYYTGAMRFLAKNYFALADGIVLQTQGAKEFFPKRIQKKSIILPNSLNPAFVKPRFEGEREKEIVAVGRLDDNKNHEMLIRAFAGITDKYPEYHVCIYGEGENRAKLQKLIETLGLVDKVKLPGKTTCIEEKIYKSSIFVLTSDTEGMPNSLIEAMALGLCVISTDCPCGGAGELIQDGVNGYLIPVRDTNALEQCIAKCLKDNDHREEVGRNAATLQDKMNPARVNELWEKYFKQIMEK